MFTSRALLLFTLLIASEIRFRPALDTGMAVSMCVILFVVTYIPAFYVFTLAREYCGWQSVLNDDLFMRRLTPIFMFCCANLLLLMSVSIFIEVLGS